MVDIMYFEWSITEQNQFKKEVREAFPYVVLSDAYNEIKGYRQAIEELGDGYTNEDFFVWALAHGWYGGSLNIQILLMSDQKEALRLFGLVKKRYPNKIKTEAQASK